MKKTTIAIFLALFCLSGFIKAQIPTDGLVLYMPFNGNANDESGKGYHGTVSGATLTNDRFGNTNKAYLFNGYDYIDCNTNIPEITDKVTYSIWFKTASTNDYSGILTSRNSAVDFTGVYLSTNGIAISSVQRVAGGVGDTTAKNCEDNVWHNIIGVYDGSEISIYVDGQFTGNRAVTGSVENIADYYIGYDTYSSSRHFNGYIDDIRVYNRALKTTEISALFNEISCSDTTISDTTINFVSNIDFQISSPQIHFMSSFRYTSSEGCDSNVNKYNKYIFEPNYYTNTITVYDSISVTDTLLIDVNLNNINTPNIVNTIKIYPNPAHSYVIINTGDYYQMDTYTIKIENLLGQIVFEKLINQAEFQIDVNDFGEYGTYLVKIYDDLGSLKETRKLILQ